ncbi:MAG: HAD-IA family hydrolase [Phycisphaeraceae bacterium]|nr:HAD-IA family hydrolase [Phycisphaeraceae bacterium]
MTTREPIKDYGFYLFDADGTLFDTTELIVRCFENTAQGHQLPFPGRDAVLRYVGLPLRTQMECYFGTLEDETFDRYRQTHLTHQMAIYRDHLKLCPGVAEALRRLNDRAKKCAVVTSRMRPSLSLYLQETGIDGYFQAIVTAESTTRHKPEPEPVLEALRQLDATAGCALVVGDSVFDIESGRRAGVDTALVAWSATAATSLAVAPTWQTSDMNDLCG